VDLLSRRKEFLQGVQDICRKNDILLMVDEVQTAFGKTGYFLACEYFGFGTGLSSVSPKRLPRDYRWG